MTIFFFSYAALLMVVTPPTVNTDSVPNESFQTLIVDGGLLGR